MRQRHGSRLSLVGALFFVSGCMIDGRTPVQVENTGAVPLHSVWVFATGDSVLLGTLAPGLVIEARLRPRGESHLEFSHEAAPGRVIADTYFEPGYRGPIRVQLQSGAARVVRHARI